MNDNKAPWAWSIDGHGNIYRHSMDVVPWCDDAFAVAIGCYRTKEAAEAELARRKQTTPTGKSDRRY